MAYVARYTDEALDDLSRLRKLARPVYQEALKLVDEVCAAPELEGKPLKREWEGCRSKHFGRDRYRLVWEVDDERECIVVLRVAHRGAQGTPVYNKPRPEQPGF